MISALISRLVILIFGTLYPAYSSYKAVKTKDIKLYVKWMMYWIVFALFISIETFTDIFLSFWFPFYYELKVIIVIWLLSPVTRGSSIMYRRVIHPLFMRREQEIDELIMKAKEQGYSAILDIGCKGMTLATNAIMTTAVKGGSGLLFQLKKSYSLNDLNIGNTKPEKFDSAIEDCEDDVYETEKAVTMKSNVTRRPFNFSRSVNRSGYDSVNDDQDRKNWPANAFSRRSTRQGFEKLDVIAEKNNRSYSIPSCDRFPSTSPYPALHRNKSLIHSSSSQLESRNRKFSLYSKLSYTGPGQRHSAKRRNSILASASGSASALALASASPSASASLFADGDQPPSNRRRYRNVLQRANSTPELSLLYSPPPSSFVENGDATEHYPLTIESPKIMNTNNTVVVVAAAAAAAKSKKYRRKRTAPKVPDPSTTSLASVLTTSVRNVVPANEDESETRRVRRIDESANTRNNVRFGSSSSVVDSADTVKEKSKRKPSSAGSKIGQLLSRSRDLLTNGWKNEDSADATHDTTLLFVVDSAAHLQTSANAPAYSSSDDSISTGGASSYSIGAFN